jgi:hypothetical protein
MKTELEGILEIDHERGVIYFHDKSNGGTALRICSLPTPIPIPKFGEGLDITHLHGTNWRGLKSKYQVANMGYNPET